MKPTKAELLNMNSEELTRFFRNGLEPINPQILADVNGTPQTDEQEQLDMYSPEFLRQT